MKIMLNNGTVSECTDKNEELHIIRHTAAHVLAQAIKRLYPNATFAYGPANEKGFYYDVDLGDTKLTDGDLATIEKEMKKITKENLPIKAFTLPRDEAIKLMEERGAKSVKSCVFLEKQISRGVTYRPDYIGYEISDAFVIGYGLDYAEKYRQLPYIGIIKPEAVK